ncbi:hypothetical protein EDB89DRAFT_844007 [Lactarius sanguifluus]|nr:hypothetical protein EDB89DRAFT_844007 [Lactarius sanguifluus]
MIPHLFSLFLSARLLSACLCSVPVFYIINTLVTEWNSSKNLTIENRDISPTQLHLSPCNISMGSVDFQQCKKNGIYQVPNIFSYSDLQHFSFHTIDEIPASGCAFAKTFAFAYI